MIKQAALILVLGIGRFAANAQSVISSNTYIQTHYHRQLCYSVNNSSNLYYDESKQAFYLVVEFSKFKSGQDTLDDWLKDLESTSLVFKVPVDKEIFQSGFSNHRVKTLKLTGQAYLNGIWHSQPIEMAVYSVENTKLGTTTNANLYDNIRVNFALSIMPKDFKIHKRPHHLKKNIQIGVTLGRINQLQPGMEKHLGEAYDHH